jgi:hypothetical protein
VQRGLAWPGLEAERPAAVGAGAVQTTTKEADNAEHVTCNVKQFISV